jgi:hypothetical protein
VDGRSFACHQLWEDTTHVLTCSCDVRCAARKSARATFQQKLTQLYTPDIMSNLICDSMDSWMARRPIILPVYGTVLMNRSRDKFVVRIELRLRLEKISLTIHTVAQTVAVSSDSPLAAEICRRRLFWMVVAESVSIGQGILD